MDTKATSPKAPNYQIMRRAWETRQEHRADFYRHVKNQDNGCNLFFPATGRGYGRFTFSGVRMRAHVYAKVINEGLPDEGQFCLHRCIATPNCVNPAHLYWANHRENMADVVRQNRSGVKRGEMSPRAVLDLVEVIAIWIEYSRYGLSSVAIASRLGRSRAMVEGIIRENTWVHVTAILQQHGYAKLDTRANAPSGEDAPTSRLSLAEVGQIRVAYGQGCNIHALAVRFRESPGNISAIVKRNSWKELDESVLLNLDGKIQRGRLISIADILFAVKRKLQSGKQFEEVAEKYKLPISWVKEAFSGKKLPKNNKGVRMWMRDARELNDIEVVTIWRLCAQAQKPVEWIVKRFSVKEQAVLDINKRAVKPHLLRRLKLKPSDGSLVIGKSGVDNAAAKLSEQEVQEIRRRAFAGEKDAAIARTCPLSSAGVSLLRRGETYKEIPWPDCIDRSKLNRVRILDADVVRKIFTHATHSLDTVSKIAERFGTTKTTVQQIRDRKSYKKITSEM